MAVIIWSLVGFLSGAIPFSVILGRLAVGQDIRQYNDHNPGAFNVFHAAGKRWGMLAIALDSLKGAIPVGLAYFIFGISGWGLALVALAPAFGHAFSPFLRGRGGKALAVTFGVWAGLTLWVGPVVLGLLCTLFYNLLNSSGWAVTLAMLLFGGFVASFLAPSQAVLLWIWLGNLALLLWKHRAELTRLPGLHPKVLRRLKGQA
ncbi:MAG: glycerol-3-phosphate acyltransferase [Chloroflexota bacterium]